MGEDGDKVVKRRKALIFNSIMGLAILAALCGVLMPVGDVQGACLNCYQEKGEPILTGISAGAFTGIFAIEGSHALCIYGASPGTLSQDVAASIAGVEYTVDEEIAAVMKGIDDLVRTLPAEGAAPETIVDLYSLEQSYLALSEEQRIFVANYGYLEAAMESIRGTIQEDRATGVNVSGLPWYVGLKVDPVDKNGELWADLKGQAGEEGTLLALFDLSLMDCATGALYKAQDKVIVTMPVPDYEGCDGMVILHRKNADSIEYIRPVINSGGTMTFVLRSFSAVGVLGYKGASPVDLIAGDEAALWWPWLLVALGIAAVIAVLALRRRDSEVAEE